MISAMWQMGSWRGLWRACRLSNHDHHLAGAFCASITLRFKRGPCASTFLALVAMRSKILGTCTVIPSVAGR